MWHHRYFDWLCVVRRAFWLDGRKYDGVLRKSVSIKKQKNQQFPSFVELFWQIFYKSNRGLFPPVYIASSKHSGSWENSRHLCKPSTTSWVCLTVSNNREGPNLITPAYCLHSNRLMFHRSMEFCYFGNTLKARHILLKCFHLHMPSFVLRKSLGRFDRGIVLVPTRVWFLIKASLFG